jgi:transmembrane sensor
MEKDLTRDLEVNPSFIDWVLSDFEINDAEWSSFIDANPDSHDRINEAIRVVLQLKGDDQIYSKKLTLFHRIENSIQKGSSKPRLSEFTSAHKFLAYAAVITLLIICISYFAGNKTITTDFGEQTTVYLPDNSKVTLNTKTTLSYNILFWPISRDVNLNGEAYFEVSKGKKFNVYSELGTVSVLGTSFNIDADWDHLDVFCYTGKVAVFDAADKSKAVLSPSQGVRIFKDSEFLYSNAGTPLSFPGWQNGRIHFDNISLEEAINVIQKYFTEKITFDQECKSKKITSEIPINNIDSALQILTWPLGLKYTKNGEEILISK